MPEPVDQYGVTDLRRIRDSCAKPERILSNIHRWAELVKETIGILYAAYVKCLPPVISTAVVGGCLKSTEHVARLHFKATESISLWHLKKNWV